MIVAIWTSCVLTGCASIESSALRQTIYVHSREPGVSVFSGQDIVGKAPGYFEVRRSHSPSIEVQTAEGIRRIPLESKYRWSRSFWSGLILFSYAPIAWIVDLSTGAAWDVKDADLGPIKIAESDRNSKPPPRAVTVAVAPPRAFSTEISDNAGDALAEHLADPTGQTPLDKGLEVAPFRKTLETFLTNDYIYEVNESDLGQRRRLYRELGVDRIYESTVVFEEGEYRLRSTVLDVVNESRSTGPTLKLTSRDTGRRLPGTGIAVAENWWTRLVPNTVGIDFVDEKLNVELATTGLSYELQPVHSDEWWATGLRYISALNITSSPDRRREYASRWEFSAVPALRLSRKRVRAVDLPIQSGSFVEKNPEFQRWIVSGGYGLEIGYLTGRHYIYLNLIPTVSWTEISWRQNGADRWASRTSVRAHTELGYTYLFDSSWMLKFFSRSQAEDSDAWQDAFRNRLLADVPVTATTVLSGITVAYQFGTYISRGTSESK